MRKNKEQALQIAVATYLKLQYPNVIFTAEGSGLPLSKAQAGMSKAMRSSSGLPDMIILSPQKNYHGLCIELKVKSPYKKNGELLKSEHLAEQEQILDRLQNLGYLAVFATGFNAAKEMIDLYFKPLK